MHITLPEPLGSWSVKTFANTYNINLSEAEKDVSEYKNIGDLFTRRLKPSVRPLSSEPIVHCADSKISQYGLIKDNTMIQAKGKDYSLKEMTQNEKAESLWNNGTFITYYLCPTDYHRVHSPVSGTIKRITYIPGALWPVNEWSVNNIPKLFSINERVSVEIETPQGIVNLIMVGATNVGKMTLSFDPEIITNQGIKEILRKEYNLPIQKGDEVGTFHMGSTVVMIYPPGMVDVSRIQSRAVRVRESVYQ